jgi:acyl-CoA dehydrogenase
MDFDLSDDQIALRDTAREMLDDLAASGRVRSFTESGAPFDRGLWGALVEQGWLLVDADERDGGLGLGVVEVAVLLEQLGAHAAPVPYLSTMLVARAHERAGAAGGRFRTGADIGCVAWSRRAGAVNAEPRAGGWILHGRTDPVPYAPVADCAVIVARMPDGGAGLFSVQLGAGDRGTGDRGTGDLPEGLARPAREPAMDVTRPLGWLRCAATPAQFLGEGAAVDTLVDEGATFVAAEMLGGAQAVLDMAVAYAKERVQFGRPIGSFQAVKHRCADMLVDVEGMRSSVYWAAWAIGAGDPDASEAAATAKIWGSDASRRVMVSGLQVHGGIGFTWEHDLHFFLKRAQLDQVTFGDADHHRSRLAARLRERVAAGASVV